jgi:catechol 2,3-dioxygenase-like lactoylglutathione lyase family enzyme
MTLTLNHFSIRSLDLDACERFYCGLLGLQKGPRPPFPFPGLWLYQGDTSVWANAAVHIIGIDQNDPEGLKRYLGDRDAASLQGTGSVDHLAFFATGLAATLQRLRAHGVPVRERTVPLLGLHQLFLDDPNGVVIELNFPAAEHAALDGAACMAPTPVPTA